MNKGLVANFRDLLVWQRSIDLVDEVYRCSARFPSAEVYGLAAQIRRAAVSVPANIAEGAGRNGRKEYIHHLGIARGSLFEVETMLIIARRQDYLTDEIHQNVVRTLGEVGRLLGGLIRSLEPRPSRPGPTQLSDPNH